MTKSYTNKSGRTVHYDEAGNRIGVSYRSKTGGRITHYDAQGNLTGRSYQNSTGRMTHYDANGQKTGTSYTAYPGRVRHYDNQWRKTGDTYKGFAAYHTEKTNSKDAGEPVGRPAGSAGCATLLVGMMGLLALAILVL